jgi:hypothetical protein
MPGPQVSDGPFLLSHTPKFESKYDSFSVFVVFFTMAIIKQLLICYELL